MRPHNTARDGQNVPERPEETDPEFGRQFRQFAAAGGPSPEETDPETVAIDSEFAAALLRTGDPDPVRTPQNDPELGIVRTRETAIPNRRTRETDRTPQNDPASTNRRRRPGTLDRQHKPPEETAAELSAGELGITIFDPETNRRRSGGRSLLWSRLPEETAAQYGMFWHYVQFGPSRSYVAVSDKFGYALKAIQTAAKRFNWPNRASAYDDHLRTIEQTAAESAAARDGQLLADRRRKVAESEETISNRLFDAANTVLERFIANPESVRHDLRSAAALADMASQLGRTAASSRNTIGQDGDGGGIVRHIAVIGVSDYRDRLDVLKPMPNVPNHDINSGDSTIITAGMAAELAEYEETD
jgi:hypothetical protein